MQQSESSISIASGRIGDNTPEHPLIYQGAIFEPYVEFETVLRIYRRDTFTVYGTLQSRALAKSTVILILCVTKTNPLYVNIGVSRFKPKTITTRYFEQIAFPNRFVPSSTGERVFTHTRCGDCKSLVVVKARKRMKCLQVTQLHWFKTHCHERSYDI